MTKAPTPIASVFLENDDEDGSSEVKDGIALVCGISFGSEAVNDPSLATEVGGSAPVGLLVGVVCGIGVASCAVLI